MEDDQLQQIPKYSNRVRLLIIVALLLAFRYSLETSGAMLGMTIRSGGRRMVEFFHLSSNDNNVDVAVKLADHEDFSVALTAMYAMTLLAPNASESGRERIVQKLSELCTGDHPKHVKCQAGVFLDLLDDSYTCDTCE
ncbi:MAG: hypothetical protein HUJ26_19870 [Planctomycetaceae bacterium]|nr:hypothetical protein [Planctomycetaceae bacterium]